MEDFLIVCLIFVIFILGILFGALVVPDESGILEAYCSSFDSKYEIVQGKESCIKDNKITPIKWYIDYFSRKK